jgi:hypothetical protein
VKSRMSMVVNRRSTRVVHQLTTHCSEGGRFQGIALKDLRELHKHSTEGSIVIMDDAICECTSFNVISIFLRLLMLMLFA